MGGIALGDDQTSASVFVEAMHDAWASDSADPAELAFAVMKQGVDQSMLLVPRRRMHNQTGRFVENQQALVFEEYVQLHRLGLGFGRPRLRPMDLNFLTGMWHMRRFDRLAV
jgi:hypothetical protein